MKKLLAILAMAVMHNVSQAQEFKLTAPTVNLSYQTQQNDNGAQGHIINTQLVEKINQHLDSDFTINNFQSDVSNAVFIRYELGATPTYQALSWLRLSSRFSMGEIQTSNHGNWETYTLEPKATVLLPYNIETFVGYRYRSGWLSTNLDTSQTWSTGVAYRFTNSDKLGVSISRLTGDNGGTANNPNRTYSLNYTHRF